MSDLSLYSCLQHLLTVMPPQAVTYVGAGNGTDPLIQFFVQGPAVDLTFVEAEERHLPHLKKNLGHRPGIRVVHQLITDRTQHATYYKANIGSESGLLDPAVLAHLWPNITVEDSDTRPGISLNEHLTDSSIAPNWLVIDCLPMLSILGDGLCLCQIDVLMGRIVQMEGDKSLHDCASLADAREFLSTHGFIHVLTQAGRHPGIGHALFVRDIRMSVSQAEEARDAHAATKAQLLTNRLEAADKVASLEGCIAQLTRRVLELEGEAEKVASLEDRIAQLTRRVLELGEERRVASETEESRQLAEHMEAATTKADELYDSIQSVQQLIVSKLGASEAAMEQYFAQNSLDAIREVVLSSVAKFVESSLEKQKALFVEAEGRQQGELQRVVQLTERVLALEVLQEATPASNQIHQLVERLDTGVAKICELQKSVNALEEVVAAQVDSTTAAMELLTGGDANAREVRLLEEQFEKQKALFAEVEVRQKRELVNATANSVKQIEAFIGIQRWLPLDDSALDFHGWPISPDLGIFLLGKIHEEKYDVIIEFGSGTSTILLARAVAQMNLESRGELPVGKKVVSFEHDRAYHEKTLKLLKSRDLLGYVNLVHSPLVVHEDSGAKYLHYDCATSLRQIAQLNEGQDLSILVLVDGPPELTCKNARYPAIPKIFDYLGKHRIDIVLDDANRPAEKEAIKMWKEYWKARSIRILDRHVPSEKGIYFASNML
ncbi:hypothetical protein [Cupriavidus sp. IK-TO18]|uniref:hypothetical protein n=1 Tax=Cupriavidus sp. IK-TO18 TaxID=2782182 RepID=UPI0018998754|nr:hypothetical protein [Cupriavidus sp. IK-TO18]MBF6987019.1 hypothetical protein [Cupriavidus sp. IK-TO18]